MTTISISQLKANPAAVIASSEDYPVAIQKRNKTKAYVVGGDLFEKMVRYLEDVVDRRAVREADYGKGRDFEEVAAELGI